MRGKVQPLPEVKPYEPFIYAATDLPDPFKPRKLTAPPGSGSGGGARGKADYRHGRRVVSYGTRRQAS